MDIKCHICGEPIDVYELHDIDGMTFHEARKAFYRDGCVGIGFTHNGNQYENGDVILALQDVLGDDVDGLASEIEDYDL